MSFRFLSSLNSPALVAGSGAAMLLVLPAVNAAAAGAASIAVCKGANLAAYLLNVASVSVPGRIDEAQDQHMRQGNLDPSKPTGGSSATSSSQTANEATSLLNNQNETVYSAARTRSLVSPSGWAFTIWAPIYIGEAAFCAAQLFEGSSGPLQAILPQVTVPFAAACAFQSLWCASFRPSYNQGWNKYVSVGMLGGTAYSLSLIQSVAATVSPAVWWWLLPMSLHCGWTTAATLVNLNGSIAMEKSDSTVIAVGHASAIVAAALGVGVGLAQAAPAYGLTVAWALAAVGNGTKRIDQNEDLKKAAAVQKMLCYAGSAACVAASVYGLM